jgi:hypothetical protein
VVSAGSFHGREGLDLSVLSSVLTDLRTELPESYPSPSLHLDQRQTSCYWRRRWVGQAHKVLKAERRLDAAPAVASYAALIRRLDWGCDPGASCADRLFCLSPWCWFLRGCCIWMTGSGQGHPGRLERLRAARDRPREVVDPTLPTPHLARRDIAREKRKTFVNRGL